MHQKLKNTIKFLQFNTNSLQFNRKVIHIIEYFICSIARMYDSMQCILYEFKG